MSYDLKIRKAQEIIEAHNETIDDSSKVDWDSFLEKLRSLGGTSEETLKSVSWEDLQSCGAPTIIARSLARIFRQRNGDNKRKSAYVSPKKIHSLSNEELLERYNPKDVKNTVGKRLKDLSDGKPFIVFDNNGKVLVKESVKILDDILNNLPPIETAFVNGIPSPVYKVGERPDFYTDENPIYPNRPLRSGQTCDQTNRSWNGVNSDIRQLLWLSIQETNELEIDSVEKAHDVLDKVMSKGCTINTLRSRYPEASKLFDEKKKNGTLPLLKIKLSKSSGEKSNVPFGTNKQY